MDFMSADLEDAMEGIGRDDDASAEPQRWPRAVPDALVRLPAWMPTICAASSTEYVRLASARGFMLLDPLGGNALHEASAGLDSVERDGTEGDHVPGARSDDPGGCTDGDIDVAVVVEGTEPRWKMRSPA